MSGRENLMFFARLHGVDARRVDELLDMVGLAER
jgi:ABC-type multidrug transport system ATPase subunit